uniref:uncharacterized protein LOC131103074 n=1 Tax=Doryrhamphus excisus TaxID=161450 RepID=UPI0025AE29C8|nr:uncharacterized protein LOC131103074 [Doryrhamphus excisus]
MTLAALLCVYWICVLLFSESVASPVKSKGYQYRSTPIARNLEDDENPLLDEEDLEYDTSDDQSSEQLQWGESSRNQPHVFGVPGGDNDDVFQQKMTILYPSPVQQPSNPQSVDKLPSSHQHPSSAPKNPNTGDNQLIFEEVFQIPPDVLSRQHPAVQRHQKHVYPARTGWHYGFLRDNRQVPSWFELQLAAQEARKSRLPPLSITQSRSHYRNGRYMFSRDRYSQNVDHPLMYR